MKLAVVASGWHFPIQFYRELPQQTIPFGWEVEYHCVSHRDPVDDKHIETLGNTPRERLDKVLYERIASLDDLKRYGWKYKLYPNTIGDWGCSNQWLEDNDFRKYDAFLFTHDDNLITGNDLLVAGIQGLKTHDIVTNSDGMPKGWLRGSCEFFSKDTMEKLGGKFDLSEVTLTRENKTDTPEGIGALDDWNKTVYPLMEFIKNNGIKVLSLSPYYRVSKHCIEGERGFIHKTHGANTEREMFGFKEIYGSI